jgi:hypothetical protein
MMVTKDDAKAEARALKADRDKRIEDIEVNTIFSK